MSVLITGATGFVGQNLVNYFENEGIAFRPTSLRNQVSKTPDDVTVIIHLAGLAHDLRKVNDEEAYFDINVGLTKKLYQAFIDSNAHTFIFLSSIKAACDKPGKTILEESYVPNPQTPYGRSKLRAEEELQKLHKKGTRLIILRPCMIHGPGNKGNLNTLFKLIKVGIPFPFGAFHNQRSYLGVRNLCFIIGEIIRQETIASGVYHVADDNPFSTIEIVELLYKQFGKKGRIWNVSSQFIKSAFRMGDKLGLPLNTESLDKLTGDFVVSNVKLKTAIGKDLPFSAEDGFTLTFQSFENEK